MTLRHVTLVDTVLLLLVISRHDCYYKYYNADGFLLPGGRRTQSTPTRIRRIQQLTTTSTKCNYDKPSILNRRKILSSLFLNPTTLPSSSSSSVEQRRQQQQQQQQLTTIKIKTKVILPTTKVPTSTRVPTATSAAISSKKTTIGPDLKTKPDYENIHGPLGKIVDDIFLSVFRTNLAYYVGVDSNYPKNDYMGLIELSNALNSRYSDRRKVQQIAQQTLSSLFPNWLPVYFTIMFAKPFPNFSSRMNAWATKMGGTWLMGECEINDIEINGIVHKSQGLLVKRCRFLEESGCASICVNSCKIPTQNFFLEDMGLPLTMTPDYETNECQFSFGQLPNEQDEFDAKNTPCLSRCPTAGAMRKWHTGSTGTIIRNSACATTGTSSCDGGGDENNPCTAEVIEESDSNYNNTCVLMENN